VPSRRVQTPKEGVLAHQDDQVPGSAVEADGPDALAVQESVELPREVSGQQGVPSDRHVDHATPRGPTSSRRRDTIFGAMDDATAPHALVRDAAEGRLPEWAVAGPGRRAHMQRVAGLLGSWAGELGLDEGEALRWRAAGWLHDALRDAPGEDLRPLVPPGERTLPPKLLHGPAAAARLREAGVSDEELLEAVARHTIGSAALGRLGRALYAADFLEPGRTFLEDWRGDLRARMPHELRSVVREIVRARIDNLLRQDQTVLEETLGFWNALVDEGA
jgi:HD superfamily phosphohydrolase YqeK